MQIYCFSAAPYPVRGLKPFVSGVVVAMVTPLGRDGAVDTEAVKWLVRALEDKGVDGLYVAGTVGESLYLRMEERLRLYQAVLEARRSAKVIASVAAATADEAVENARKLRDVEVDAVFTTPPLYYKPSKQALVDFFARVADAADRPLVVYTISSHVGYAVPVDVVYQLAVEHSGVVGVKVTEPDLHYLHRLVHLVKPVRRDFAVLTGYGEYMLSALAAGADGAVDAIANLVPGLLVGVYRSWAQGRYEEAVRMQRAFIELSVRAAASPSLVKLIKALLGALGAPVGPYARVPEQQPPGELVNGLRALLCARYSEYLVTSEGCTKD